MSAVYIEFLTDFGDLPLMRSDITAIQNIDPYLATLNFGYIMNITEYQKGENIYTPSARALLYSYIILARDRLCRHYY